MLVHHPTFLSGWDARLQLSAEDLEVSSGTTSFGAPTRFCCRGPLERRSGTPSSAALRRLAFRRPRRRTADCGWVARCPVHPQSSTSPSCRHCCGSKSALSGRHSAREASAVLVAGRVAVRTRPFRSTFGRCPSRVHGCTAAELLLSLFRLVQSRIEGLGLGEADMLPQALRLQSPQESVERQGLPCSRGEFRVAASGQELDVSSVDAQALLLPAAVRSQQLLALVAGDPFTQPPLQCSDQGLKVSLVRLVQVEHQASTAVPSNARARWTTASSVHQPLCHAASRNWARYGSSCVTPENFGSRTAVLDTRG
ncbi:unnamed protein product, partial [Boreogadus saida]